MIWRVLVYAVFLTTSVSCATVYQIPPALTTEQRAELMSSPYSKFVIGINTTSGMQDGKYFSEYVVDDFKTLFTRSGLFKEVNLTSALSTPPDLVVDLRSGPSPVLCITGEASAMIMTLGIVPLKVRDNKKYSFTIANPGKSKTLYLEFTYIGKSYLGSISSLKSISSNWSTTPQEERNYELFAYQLISMRKKILDLVTDK